MKTIFEGEINGVKYTDEKSFIAALESAKSSGTIRSMSYQTQRVDDDNQLDLFDEKICKIDNLFPSIDQAIDAMESCEDGCELLGTIEEIEKDLDGRFNWLNKEKSHLDFRGVFDKIKESRRRIDVAKNHYDNEHRLLMKEREDIEDQLGDLEERETKNDFMTDLMNVMEDYFNGIETNINNHLKSKEKKEPALKVNEKPEKMYNIDTDTLEKLSKAFEVLEQLWK